MIQELFNAQRRFFLTHATKDTAFRRKALKTLKKAIKEWEPRLCEALEQDLGKCATESYMSEIGMVLGGLSDTLSHLRSWSRSRSVLAPLAHFPSTCRIEQEPYGVTLVMAPWNYPVLLSLDPLIASLAAGNTCILKPSELAPATAAVLAAMLGEIFPREYVAVVEGDVEICNELLEKPFDYIFFTGAPGIGKIVMAAAAKNLTPVTLELGGKSPCIVDETADIKTAATRIAFGKILNAGQTCVAPDYLLIHASRKEEFITAYRNAVAKMAGHHPLQNDKFPHIINRRHFDRVMGLLKGANAALGGKGDAETLRIEPTLLTGVTPDSPCMQQEIFGPVLPMLTYESLDEAELFVLSRPKPLACYVFTRNKATEKRLLSHLSFGGGCVNDTIVHLSVPALPFGGVGNSGMGAYHGKAGFDTFSHARSVLKKANWLDLPFRYQPFNGFKNFVLRLFLR